MKIFRNFKEGLSRNVIILGIVSGLTDISSEMLYPVIPIFLTQFLNAPMSVVGLIEGIAESTASILKIWGGYLSDKFRKRKIFVLIGYSLSAISKPVMALAYSWYFVLFARFIDRVGKGIRTAPRDALISSSTDKQYYGKAFGFHRAMDTLGAATGPIITMLLFFILTDSEKTYRMIFIIAFIPAIIGVLILKRYIKDENEIISGEGEKINTKKDPLSLDIKIFTAIYAIFSLAKFSDAFLIMKTKEAGFSTAQTIILYFFYNVLYATLATPSGIISDKIGKLKIFMLSFLIYSTVSISFALSISKPMIIFSFMLYSFYGALNEGIAKAIISSMTGINNRATAMGVFQGVSGIMAFFSSLIAGILWDKFTPSTPFIFSAGLSFLSFAGFYIWKNIRNIKI